jgi:hypothetical protein
MGRPPPIIDHMSTYATDYEATKRFHQGALYAGFAPESL